MAFLIRNYDYVDSGPPIVTAYVANSGDLSSPEASAARDNSEVLDTSTQDLYIKVDGTWVKL